VDPFTQFTPPGLVTTLTGYCHSQCTEDNLPEEGVKAFSSILHAHTVGAALSLRHIRDGVELAPLDINEHYDFNYQQNTYFDEEVDILPGDQFIVHCTYDTTERDEMVLAGQGSRQEMCVAFVWVYPVPDFFMCMSSIGETAINNWLNDAYEEGYWDVNVNGSSIANLKEAEVIGNASDIPPVLWSYYGGYWNEGMDGAADFYEKFWDDSGEYTERNGACYNGQGEYSETAISSLKEEFGDFEEYCTDSCGCDEEAEEAAEEDDDNSDTYMIVGIVVGAVLLIIIIVVVMLVMKNRKLKVSMNKDAIHVPGTSAETTTAGAGETASAASAAP